MFGPLFIGSMEISHQAESDTMLNKKPVLVKLWGKEGFGTVGTDIWEPDYMFRCKIL